MTITDAPADSPRLLDEDLTRRALHVVTTGTTDMAPDVLRASLGYCRDPDVLQRESRRATSERRGRRRRRRAPSQRVPTPSLPSM